MPVRGASGTPADDPGDPSRNPSGARPEGPARPGAISPASAGSAYQLAVLGMVGLLAGWWLTGTLPPNAALAPFVILSSVLALALVLLCHLQLGYAAVWFGTAAPAFWVWQKLFFVLCAALQPERLRPPAAARAMAGPPARHP